MLRMSALTLLTGSYGAGPVSLQGRQRTTGGWSAIGHERPDGHGQFHDALDYERNDFSMMIVCE
jgi:hypothetical protein